MTSQLSIFDDTSATSPSRPDAAQLLNQLKELLEAGVIAEIDYFFPLFLHNRLDEHNASVLKAAALLTYANRQGHVAVELEQFSQHTPLFQESHRRQDEVPVMAGENDWPAGLKNSRVIGEGDSQNLMILEKGRLYLQKYRKYEIELATFIAERSRTFQAFITSSPEPEDAQFEQVRKILGQLFTHDASPSHLQKSACMCTLFSTFTVITGGPGTGKTHTVLRLLALLISLSDQPNLAGHFGLRNPLRIAIAAPTGKAAARVRESIVNGIKNLDIHEHIISHIPGDAQTIHRLLKPVPNSPHFRHNQENPLPYDVVVVDEASMVDLALMNKLFAALRSETRLVLLGDKDQLASVEAGSVLGDICRTSGQALNAVSRKYSGILNKCGVTVSEKFIHDEENPLQDVITELTQSHRFSDDSAIGSLARQVNAMDAGAVIRTLNDSASASVTWSDPAHLNSIMNPQAEHLQKLTDSSLSAAELFEHIRSSQILCAHKRGPYGADQINSKLELKLRPKSGRYVKSEWFPGRVVMFTRNDYHLGLFNGDIGITRYNAAKDRLEVIVERSADENGEKQFEALSTAQIQACETCWAMTVHKSQGSEFYHVILILPERPSPVLSKELFYTALTRSRESFQLVSSKEVLRAAINRKVERSSGLGYRLWGT